jgi:hypothetical protein
MNSGAILLAVMTAVTVVVSFGIIPSGIDPIKF